MIARLMSVHFPKAGGTSFRHALQAAVGDAVLPDYSEDPASPLSPRNLDPRGYFGQGRRFPQGVQCVHGHFHPNKYGHGDGIVRYTLLRHPVDTMISTYYYWQTIADGGPLHRYAMDQRLGLLEVAQLPLLQTLMSWTYFGGVNMRSFDIIGSYENRTQSIEKLGSMIGVELNASLQENQTPPSDERFDAIANAALRRRLTNLLRADVDFYDRWAGYTR